MSFQSVFKKKFNIKNPITSMKSKKQKNKHISSVPSEETYHKLDTTDNGINEHLITEKLHLNESSKCSLNENNSIKELKINKKKRKSTEKNNEAEMPTKKRVTFAADVKSDTDGEKCTAGKMKPLSLNKRKKLNYIKKLKAKKNKQKNAKKNEENTSANQTPRQERAIEYLKEWKNDRSNWKFKKIYQLWLVKNTYDTTKISQEDFKILVEYLQTIEGKSRCLILQSANTIVASVSNEQQDKLNQSQMNKYQRARSIIQIFD